MDVQADHRAIHDEPTRTELSPCREAGGKAAGDLLGGSRKVGLANVESSGHSSIRPRLEVDVPQWAVVELRCLLGYFFQDVQRRDPIENGCVRSDASVMT